MVKHGNVIVGATPSSVSGKPSETLKEGEPVCTHEHDEDPGLKKLASKLSLTKEPS